VGDAADHLDAVEFVTVGGRGEEDGGTGRGSVDDGDGEADGIAEVGLADGVPEVPGLARNHRPAVVGERLVVGHTHPRAP
jgi:hypothetical protein